uniref:ShKT domain-containing protein n=1 Tax=Lepeophtheirus salmonis TaxID=72036 RepID=A0A0K2VEM7_LEPSM
MKSLYFVLSACFFYGIISEKDCLDSPESNCRSQKDQCFDSSIQFVCPQTCGVCNAICKDYNSNCLTEESQCILNNNLLDECPKTYAKCDVCEDLIDSSICETKLSECAQNQMKYACRKSCKHCEDKCNDVGSHDLCSEHVRRGDCEKNEAVKRMCRKSCELCEVEQC